MNQQTDPFAPFQQFRQSLGGSPSAQQAQSDLSRFATVQRSAGDIFNSANNQFGVGDQQNRVSQLRQQMGNTQNLLRAVPQDAQARTSGSLVSNSALNRIVAQEQAPLTDMLSVQGTNLSNASGDLQNAQQQANVLTSLLTGEQSALQDFLQQRFGNAMSLEAAAREQAAKQAELSRIQSLFDNIASKIDGLGNTLNKRNQDIANNNNILDQFLSGPLTVSTAPVNRVTPLTINPQKTAPISLFQPTVNTQKTGTVVNNGGLNVLRNSNTSNLAVKSSAPSSTVRVVNPINTARLLVR